MTSPEPQGSGLFLFWGVLRRTPQTPRSLRRSESGCARSPLPPGVARTQIPALLLVPRGAARALHRAAHALCPEPALHRAPARCREAARPRARSARSTSRSTFERASSRFRTWSRVFWLVTTSRPWCRACWRRCAARRARARGVEPRDAGELDVQLHLGGDLVDVLSSRAGRAHRAPLDRRDRDEHASRDPDRFRHGATVSPCGRRRQAAESVHTEGTMRALVLDRPGSPLREEERPLPEPGPGAVRVRVRACGVCRTDLHVVDGELPDLGRAVVPGHQIVGIVEATGAGVVGLASASASGSPGSAGPVAAAGSASRDRENLCADARFTGYTLDGGFAEHATRRRPLLFPHPRRLPRPPGGAAPVRGADRLPLAPPRRATPSGSASTDSARRRTS